MAKATDDTHNPLRMCFENSEPKQAQIARAVKILLELLDKPENPTMMKRWAQLLQPFSGEQLATAFNAVALTSNGWPTLGNITDQVLEAEWAEESVWMYQALRRHSTDWHDRDAVYSQLKRVPGGKMDEFLPQTIITPAVPAPVIPPRLVAAITLMGGGALKDGLRELAKHPACHAYQWDAAEASKMAFQVNRDFRSAWLAVRKRELGGPR